LTIHAEGIGHEVERKSIEKTKNKSSNTKKKKNQDAKKKFNDRKGAKKSWRCFQRGRDAEAVLGGFILKGEKEKKLIKGHFSREREGRTSQLEYALRGASRDRKRGEAKSFDNGEQGFGGKNRKLSSNGRA